MSSAWEVGPHEVRLLDGETLIIEYHGDVERSDATRIVELVSAHLRDGWLLVDVRDVGYICPEARRELTGLHAVAAPCQRRIDVGFVGAALPTRVLMTSLVAAATAMRRLRVDVHFFETREDADRAISVRR